MTSLVVPTSTSPSSAVWTFGADGVSPPSYRIEGVRLGFSRAGYGTDWNSATRAEVSLVHYVEPDFTAMLDQLRSMAESCVSSTGAFWKGIDEAAAAISSTGERKCTRSDFVWSIFQAAVAKSYGVKFGMSLWSTVMELSIAAPPMIVGAPPGGCTRITSLPLLLEEVMSAVGPSEDGGKPYLKVAYVIKSVRIVKSSKVGTYNAYVDTVMKGCSKSVKPSTLEIVSTRFQRTSVPDDAKDAADLKALLGE